MNDGKFIATFGAKAAIKSPKPVITITVTTKLTKRYIWLMKCRYIWAVIRADIKPTN